MWSLLICQRILNRAQVQCENLQTLQYMLLYQKCIAAEAFRAVGLYRNTGAADVERPFCVVRDHTNWGQVKTTKSRTWARLFETEIKNAVKWISALRKRIGVRIKSESSENKVRSMGACMEQTRRRSIMKNWCRKQLYKCTVTLNYVVFGWFHTNVHSLTLCLSLSWQWEALLVAHLQCCHRWGLWLHYKVWFIYRDQCESKPDQLQL